MNLSDLRLGVDNSFILFIYSCLFLFKWEDYNIMGLISADSEAESPSQLVMAGSNSLDLET
jgi:hypothetical protein